MNDCFGGKGKVYLYIGKSNNPPYLYKLLSFIYFLISGLYVVSSLEMLFKSCT